MSCVPGEKTNSSAQSNNTRILRAKVMFEVSFRRFGCCCVVIRAPGAIAVAGSPSPCLVVWNVMFFKSRNEAVEWRVSLMRSNLSVCYKNKNMNKTLNIQTVSFQSRSNCLVRCQQTSRGCEAQGWDGGAKGGGREKKGEGNPGVGALDFFILFNRWKFQREGIASTESVTESWIPGLGCEAGSGFVWENVVHVGKGGPWPKVSMYSPGRGHGLFAVLQACQRVSAGASHRCASWAVRRGAALGMQTPTLQN